MEVRPHPVTLVKPSLWLLGAVTLFALAPVKFLFYVVIGAISYFLWHVAVWWHDRYILSTERIISLYGIFNKKVVSMPLAKITDLTYERPLIGRLLGYGTIDLESAGQEGLDRIEYLPESDHFYRALMALAIGPKKDAIQVAENEARAAKSFVHEPPKPMQDAVPIVDVSQVIATDVDDGANTNGSHIGETRSRESDDEENDDDDRTMQIPAVRTSDD